MAERSDIHAPVTLEISGGNVTPEKFKRGVNAFLDLLKEVTETIDGPRPDWRIQVKASSNLIGALDAAAGELGAIPAVLSDGLTVLEARAESPDYFSDKALRYARSLARTASGDDVLVRLWTPGAEVRITGRTDANAGEILEGEFTEMGAVQGRLETLSAHGGFKFVIYEPLGNRAVKCMIPESLMEQATSVFRRRVEVYGAVRYRRDGLAVSVAVEEIDVFPHADALPGFRDVQGILGRA